MSLPSANYITDLDPAQPVGSQNISEGDDWLRLLQTVMKQSLPGVGGAVNATHTELNYVVGVTSLIQNQLNALTLGVTAALGNAPLWVSGNTYAVPAVVYSPLNFHNYRKITASSVTSTDPSLDSTNWLDLTPVQGMALLDVKAATGSTVDFTSFITSTYDEYEFHLQNVVLASSSALQGRVSTDGGATFVSSAGAYSYLVNSQNTATPAPAGQGSTNTSILMGVSGASTTAAHGGISGVIRLIAPAGTAAFKSVMGQLRSALGASSEEHATIAGTYLAATAVNGFRFVPIAGGFTSGSIKMYGLKKTV